MPTAVESHIANATLSSVEALVSLVSSLRALGYLLNPRQRKTRYISVTGFFNLKSVQGVVVPTAVESHSEILHYLCIGSRFARPTYVMSVV